MITIDSKPNKLIRRFQQSIVTKNMYALRVLAGLSTSELATLTGTTRQTINSLENGKTEMMSGTLLVATKAVLYERAGNNASNSFCLALLELALPLLFDHTLPIGETLSPSQQRCVTDAFLAVAKLSEAGFSESKLEKFSESILKMELTEYDAMVITGIDETTGNHQTMSMYDVIGLPDFFTGRRKAKKQAVEELRQTYIDEFRKGSDV